MNEFTETPIPEEPNDRPTTTDFHVYGAPGQLLFDDAMESFTSENDPADGEPSSEELSADPGITPSPETLERFDAEFREFTIPQDSLDGVFHILGANVFDGGLEDPEPSRTSASAEASPEVLEVPATAAEESGVSATAHLLEATGARQNDQPSVLENLPAYLRPSDGNSFEDRLESLDVAFDEGEPSDVIPIPEWPDPEEPCEDIDGCCEIEHDSNTMPNDHKAISGVVALDPLAYEDQVIQAFRGAAAARGILLPATLIADGGSYRCNVKGTGGENDACYRLCMDEIPLGSFRNWKDGKGWENWSFKTAPGAMIAPEKLDEMERNARALRKAEGEMAREKAQKWAQRVWHFAKPCSEHPYLTTKGISPHGVRIASFGVHEGKLVVPAIDTKSTIHTLQYISHDGEKRFVAGGRKRGCYFPIGQLVQCIFIAEGFATAASIHEATGEGVLVAFDCGNLQAVAEAAHAFYPDTPIVIAADDDYRTEGNPGLTKAKAAAESVGGLVVIPDFGEERPEGATDFNDLAKAQGLEAVADCIQKQIRTEEQDNLPRVYLDGAPEHKVVSEVLGLLSKQRRIFRHGNRFARVAQNLGNLGSREPARPSILPISVPMMRLEISRVASIYQAKKDGFGRTLVPDWLSKLSLEMIEDPSVLRLHTLTETPIVLPDGTVHDTPGYDPSTGVFYAPLGQIPSVKANPTMEDAQAASAAIFDLVSDFPFATDKHKAAWLALLLTMPARFAIPGPVPFWLIDANGQSAGKGLLTYLTSIITMGRDPVAMVGSRDQEEFGKNLLCTLMNGARLAWLDEAQSPFGGPKWNGLMTSTTHQGRILGESKTWEGPHFTVWVVTGNNVQLASDTPRRCVHVRLEPSEERPEERGGFKIADIVAHTKKHRVELLGHVLTILRAYVLAGKPQNDLTPWGSFEEWSKLIRECVYWCTGIDCDTRKELTATSDPAREMSALLIDQLADLFPEERTFLASDILTAYEERSIGGWAYPGLREALDTINTNPRGLNARSLGNLLRSRRDRTFNGLVLKGSTGGKQGMVYRIVQVGHRDPLTPRLPEVDLQPNFSFNSLSVAQTTRVDFSLPASLTGRTAVPPAAPTVDVPEAPKLPPTPPSAHERL
ncbi:MAG: hypothetical protein H6Q00_1826 [Holophagaceae bacterium]|nr:hypothetical protein [Holophagaceae bacterium]